MVVDLDGINHLGDGETSNKIYFSVEIGKPLVR